MFCTKSVAWLYRADKNFSWDSGIPVAADQVFLDATGKVRLVIETGGRMTVTRGYSWNGCSPKFCFLDLLIGTPDGVVDADTGRPKTLCVDASVGWAPPRYCRSFRALGEHVTLWRHHDCDVPDGGCRRRARSL